MKLAIVPIEDKRFADHNGVDIPGTLTGLAGSSKAGAMHAAGRPSSSSTSRTTTCWSTPRPEAQRQAAAETTLGPQAARDPGWRWLDKTPTKP